MATDAIPKIGVELCRACLARRTERLYPIVYNWAAIACLRSYGSERLDIAVRQRNAIAQQISNDIRKTPESNTKNVLVL
jgi:hypothetical protein